MCVRARACVRSCAKACVFVCERERGGDRESDGERDFIAQDKVQGNGAEKVLLLKSP